MDVRVRFGKNPAMWLHDVDGSKESPRSIIDGCHDNPYRNIPTRIYFDSVPLIGDDIGKNLVSLGAAEDSCRIFICDNRDWV